MEHVSKKISFYLFLFIVVLLVSTFGNKILKWFDKQTEEDEYGLIRKYLLNDSPLYGFNKPKLWIHSKYEINSRVWKSFNSRNSTDLNQPYINLTIKSIVDYCGDDFNICLIDDNSFSKLIPSWDIKINELSEPMKSHMREYGMMFLLYIYGGIIVPNSFICFKSLKELYDKGILHKKPFISENINLATDNVQDNKRLLFVPDTFFIGCHKDDPVIREMLHFLKKNNNNHHFSSENEFLGTTSKWCLDKISLNKMTLIGGEIIGVKTVDKKVILLEDLMEEDFLNLHNECFGIYIPYDQLLRRIKYQWFCVLSPEEVLKSSAIIAKYLKSSIVDIYKKNTSQIIKSKI
jgi:hypothetical protein